MATIKKVKKYQTGGSKKPTPTYKNLPMGVQNEYYQITGETRNDLKPTSRDSARYRGGFEEGLKNRGKKNIKAPYGEQNIEKMGRWEGQNTPQKKKGGDVKKKMKTGGTLTPSKKNVGKTIGKLNKAKSGAKISKKK